MMKTKLLIMVCFLLGTVSYAQPPQGHEIPHGNKEKREKIAAMKVEYFTSQLELTPTEAQQFWPVYNEFISKVHELERAKRKLMKKDREDVALSDAEVNMRIQKIFNTEQQILDLKREYDLKFKKVLPVQKVGKLYNAEQSFRHELLRKMKEGGGLPR